MLANSTPPQACVVVSLTAKLITRCSVLDWILSGASAKFPLAFPQRKVSSKAFFGFEFFAAAFLKEFPRYFWRGCRRECYLRACPKVQRNGAVSAAENRRDRPENRTAGAAQLLRISALVRFSGWCGGIWSACRVSSGGVQPRYGVRSAVPSGGRAGVSQELQMGQKFGDRCRNRAGFRRRFAQRRRGGQRSRLPARLGVRTPARRPDGCAIHLPCERQRRGSRGQRAAAWGVGGSRTR